MADYCDVIEQFNRMCNFYKDCHNCPMRPYGRPEDRGKDEAVQNMCRAFAFYSSKVFEHRILEWVAEYPEPVYPTWLELAAQQGFKIEEGKQCTDEKQLLILLMASVNTPIPADTAQKLGIHPVPIVHSDCGATNAEEARKRLGIEPKEM